MGKTKSKAVVYVIAPAAQEELKEECILTLLPFIASLIHYNNKHLNFI